MLYTTPQGDDRLCAQTRPCTAGYKYNPTREVKPMPSEISMLSFLSVLASLVLVIASLYWAKAVLVPLALALILTFLLQPIVAALHRRGLGYTPATGAVVLLLGPPL